MRNRMRNELSRAEPGEFDLKQDPGGIADIEFLAQYWALTWAGRLPAGGDVLAIPSASSNRWRPRTWCRRAESTSSSGAYRDYRTCLHHRALDGQGAIVAASAFRAERAAVIAIWDEVMGA